MLPPCAVQRLLVAFCPLLHEHTFCTHALPVNESLEVWCFPAWHAEQELDAATKKWFFLQDTHFSTPLVGQAEPVAALPPSQEQDVSEHTVPLSEFWKYPSAQPTHTALVICSRRCASTVSSSLFGLPLPPLPLSGLEPPEPPSEGCATDVFNSKFWWQDTHLASPFEGQLVPVAPLPLEHEHAF